MTKKRIQKQTDRTNIDSECIQRLNAIHNMIKNATLEGTVAVIPKNDDEVLNAKYNLLRIKQTRITNKARSSENTSRSTIFRDLALLRATIKDGGFEAPIQFDYSKKGYYYTDTNFELVTYDSSLESLVSLATAKIILSDLSNNSPVYKKISEITDQVTGYTDLAKRIAIAPRPKEKLKNIIWSNIATSISENRKIKIIHSTKNKRSKIKSTELIFSPFQLIYDEQSSYYYLYGQGEVDVPYNQLFSFESYSEDFYFWGHKNPTETRKFITLIKCSQIESIEITDEHFSLSKEFDSTKNYMTQNIGIRKTIWDKEALNIKPEIKTIITKYQNATQNDNSSNNKITIKVYNKARAQFKEQSFAEDLEILEETSDDITVSFTPNFSDILKWCLSLGSEIVPLAPQNLVNNWKREVIESFKQHITKDDLNFYEEMNKDLESIKKS